MIVAVIIAIMIIIKVLVTVIVIECMIEVMFYSFELFKNPTVLFKYEWRFIGHQALKGYALWGLMMK